MMRAHQPGSRPLDIPEAIPNPAVPQTTPVHACRRQVHHHHSGLGIALEVAGIFEACRADARRKSEISVVGGRDRLLVVLDLDHTGHWTEDFLARNPHAVVDPGEQGRLQIEAGRLPVENLAAHRICVLRD